MALLLDSIFAPRSERNVLQARIGVGFGIVALLIAGLNFGQMRLHYDRSIAAALVSPFTLVLFLEGLTFFASAWKESKVFQWLQVAFFMLNAYLSAFTITDTSDLTSGVYLVIAMWLLVFYGLAPNKHGRVAALLLVPYVVLLGFGIAANASESRGPYYLGSTLLLVFGLAWVFYNLAAARFEEQRQREEELEEKVRERTRELERLAEQRATIIREIHHRVKNNLQLTASLLNLAQRQATEEDPKEVYRASVSRVESIALVHEQLYMDERFGQVSLEAYLTDLCQRLEQTYGVSIAGEIRLTHVDQVTLDFAVPLGLIVNELVSNAAKHRADASGPVGRSGRRDTDIRFTATDDTEHLRLTVWDPAASVPAGFDPDANASMGFRILQALVAQLEGTSAADATDGLSWKLSFPRPRNQLSQDAAAG